jgi:hypothetical protein
MWREYSQCPVRTSPFVRALLTPTGLCESVDIQLMINMRCVAAQAQCKSL